MRQIRAVITILALLISALAGPALAADSRDQTVFLVRSGLPGCEPTCPEWVYITGKISRQTVKDFEAVLKDKAWEKPPVVFNSKGGGVDSSMAIGRLIRKHGLATIIGNVNFEYCDPLAEACRPAEKGRFYLGDVVDQAAFCEASCVIAYAGGVRRLRTYSFIAIPPFTDKAYETRKDKPDKKYLAEIDAYFKEMGVAQQVFDYLANGALPDGKAFSWEFLLSSRLATESTSASALVTAVVCKSASPAVHCITRAAEKPSKTGGMAPKVAEKTKEKPAKKKKAEPEKKESYQLPMKVVVVRSSEAGCEPTCPEWIQAEGEIKENSAAEFRKVFKQIGKRKLPVIIRSPGGSVNAALEIGRMIRKRGLAVAVGFTVFKDCAPHDKACKLPKEQKGVYRGTAMDFYAFCTSACPLILASGTERIASDATYVGLHQIRSTVVQQRITYREKYKIVKGKKKVVQRKEVSRKTVKSYEKHGLDKPLRKKLIAYLNEMGVGLGVLEDMEKAPPSEMYKLPAARVKELKLITPGSTMKSLTAARICSEQTLPGNCELDESSNKQKPIVSAALTVSQEAKPDDEKKLDGSISTLTQPMTFTLTRTADSTCGWHCPHWIAAQGQITPDTPQQFSELMVRLGDKRLPVVIHSDGGDLAAAMELGRVIRKYYLETGIGETAILACDSKTLNCFKTEKGDLSRRGTILNKGNCSAACIVVLASGVRRYSSENPVMKIDWPLIYKSEKIAISGPQVVAFLNDMGISQRFEKIVQVAKTTPLRSLTPMEIRITALTDSVSADRLMNGGICSELSSTPNCIVALKSPAASSN